MFKTMNSRAVVKLVLLSAATVSGYAASGQAQTYQYIPPPGTAKNPATMYYDTNPYNGSNGNYAYNPGYNNYSRQNYALNAPTKPSPTAEAQGRAERLFEIGTDALDDGDRASACTAFKGAERLFKQVHDDTRQQESAAMADQACAKSS